MNILIKFKNWVLLPTNGEPTKICPHCRTEIDVNAKICPQCRKKQPNRTKRIILIIFIAMVLLTMCSEDTESTSTKTSSDSSKTTETTKNKDKDETQNKETSKSTKKPTEKPTKKPKTKEQLEQEKANFIKSCKAYKFKDLLRNPDDYKNKKIKIKGKIEQTVSGGFLDDTKYYRVLVDTDGDGYYLDDEEYYVADKRTDSKPKLLDDDVIELYGVYDGTEELTRVLGNSSEIPKIKMKYVKLISE